MSAPDSRRELTINAAGCTIAHACNINNRKSLFLNRLLSTGSELPFGESMGVERQNGVDLQFESVQVIDQVHLAADGKGQVWGSGRTSLKQICFDQNVILRKVHHQESSGVLTVPN